MGNQDSKSSLGQGLGYRIISISENSPCAIAGVNYFTDFVIDVIPGHNQSLEAVPSSSNEVYKINEKKDFFQIISSNENSPLSLVIFNILTTEVRSIEITPNKQWSQAGNLLGITLRLENYLNYSSNSFRVLNVDPSSPAQKAGLIAKQDYVIGLKKYKYEGIDEFVNIIADNEGNDVELVVYCPADKILKNIILKPQANWGGRGLVGCEFAGGFLNQLPVLKSTNLSTDNSSSKPVNAQLNTVSQNIQEQPKAKPETSLSTSPPPTEIQKEVLKQDEQQVVQSNIVPHQHHLVHQLHLKQEKQKANQKKEHIIPHNTNPFAVNQEMIQSDKVNEESTVVNSEEEESVENQEVNQDINQDIQTVIEENNENQTQIQEIPSQQIDEQPEDEEKVKRSKNQNIPIEVDQNNKIEEIKTEQESEQIEQHQTLEEEVKLNEEPKQLNETIEQEVITKFPENDVLSSKQLFYFDCASLSEGSRYVIPIENLFQLDVKILQKNLLLDEKEIRIY